MKKSSFQYGMKFSIGNGFFIPGPSLAAEKQGLGLKISIENEIFKPRMKSSYVGEWFFSCVRARANFFRSPGPLGACLSGRVRPRQGTEICKFGVPSPLDFFGVFSSVGQKLRGKGRLLAEQIFHRFSGFFRGFCRQSFSPHSSAKSRRPQNFLPTTPTPWAGVKCGKTVEILSKNPQNCPLPPRV